MDNINNKAKIHEVCPPSSSESSAELRSLTHKDEDEDEDESFIELSSVSMQPLAQEFEFRIRSSSVSIPERHCLISADELFNNGRIISMPNSDELTNIQSSSNHEAQFARSRSSPVISDSKDAHEPSAAAGKDQKLTGIRTPSKTIVMILSGGVVKFLIRLPLKKIRSSFSSLIKSFDASNHSSSKAGLDDGTQQRSDRPMTGTTMLPFSKWVPQKKSRSNGLHGGKIYDCEKVRKQRRTEILAGNTRGALEKDSSISAAIAHCKMSLERGDHRLR